MRLPLFRAGLALRASLFGLALVLIAGCAATEPHVLVLPGTGKTLDRFTADDTACRAWASQQQGARTQWRYDIAYTQCMYSKGNRVPIAGGGSEPSTRSTAPPNVPPPPSGTPPPPPSTPR